MLMLKLRGRHCPTHYIARTGTSSERKSDGRIIYEVNPDALVDIIDELCDKIVETEREVGRLQIELSKLRPAPVHVQEDGRVRLGGGYGD